MDTTGQTTRSSIQYRLRLVGMVVVTAIIGAAGLVIQMQRLAAIDAFRIAIVNLTRGMAEQSQQTLRSVDQALSEVTDRLSALDDATDDVNAVMRSRATYDLLLELTKRLPAVASLSLMGAEGRVENTSREWPAIATTAADQDYFRHGRTHDEHAAFASAPIKDPVSGEWTVLLARRIDDTHARFSGMVVAEIAMTELTNFYRLEMPPRRVVYLLRRDGMILARYPKLDEQVGKTIPLMSPWYAVLARGGGAYDGPAFFDAEKIIAAVQPLAGLPFVVEASVNESVTLSAWYEQRLWVFVGSLSAIICAVILLRLFGGQYRRLELSEQSLALNHAALDIAHRRLDATLASLSQGVCFYGEDKKLLVCNRRFCDLCDLPEGSVRPGMTLAEVCALRVAAGSFPCQPIDSYLASIDSIVGAGYAKEWTAELANGRVFSMHVQPLPGQGWVMTCEDITRRREDEAKILYLARHDVLTGLANRALFEERLHAAVALARRGAGFAVLCLDLDRFKAVNDTYGHPVGDSLLRAVADRLCAAVRDTDTVARLGGDEFAVILFGTAEAAIAASLASRIVESISRTFELDGHQLHVGTSVGIALAGHDDANPVQMMKDADRALYLAKQDGRGTWRFSDPAVGASAAAG